MGLFFVGQRNGGMRGKKKDGLGGRERERVGSLTFLWAMCVSSVNTFWILLTGVDTPFHFLSTHCELSRGNAIERGQWDLLKGSF